MNWYLVSFELRDGTRFSEEMEAFEWRDAEARGRRAYPAAVSVYAERLHVEPAWR